MNEELIGNLSTVVKAISMLIAGQFLGLLAAQGFDFGVDAATLSQVIGAFIFLLLAYVDAKYPNCFKFLGNAGEDFDLETEEIVLNDEYET